MGYTHYWTQKKDFSPPAFQAMAADVRCILDKSGVPLANGYGVPGTKPQFDKNRIWFNGVGPDDDHETMAIEAEMGWAFCKTDGAQALRQGGDRRADLPRRQLGLRGQIGRWSRGVGGRGGVGQAGAAGKGRLSGLPVKK